MVCTCAWYAWCTWFCSMAAFVMCFNHDHATFMQLAGIIIPPHPHARLLMHRNAFLIPFAGILKTLTFIWMWHFASHVCAIISISICCSLPCSHVSPYLVLSPLATTCAPPTLQPTDLHRLCTLPLSCTFSWTRLFLTSSTAANQPGECALVFCCTHCATASAIARPGLCVQPPLGFGQGCAWNVAVHP